MSTTTYDYIVVGAGSAGCVVAHRLSQDASVLLLERGPSDREPAHAGTLAMPTNVLGAIFHATLSVPYYTEPQATVLDRPTYIRRGVVRGGCSSINGMLYVRGNRRDYDLWAQLHNTGWSYDDVLPAFVRSENYAGGVAAYHGVGGPLDVRPLPNPSPAALAFIDAASRLGFPASNPTWDFNGARQENAAALYQVTVTPDGRRASASSAFLDPIGGRPTLTEITGIRVTRVNLEGRRAVGVDWLPAGGGAGGTYRAERAIVIAAGAFESPKLLLLSGIGPAERLRAHGIAPVIDLPGVGQNLHDHVQVQLHYRARRSAGSSTFTAEAGLFTYSRHRPAAAAPDLQYHALAGMQGLGDPTTPTFLICPVLCAPQSRGTVSLRGPDPLEPPVLQPNWFQSDVDMNVMLEGIELAEDLAHTGALGDLVDPNTGAFGFDFGTRVGDAWSVVALDTPGVDRREFIKRTVLTVWHPAGTCRMGTKEDALAVVGPTLGVHGIERLYVADASVMPAAPSGNINAACLMIGERCADFIRSAR